MGLWGRAVAASVAAGVVGVMAALYPTGGFEVLPPMGRVVVSVAFAVFCCALVPPLEYWARRWRG